MEILLPIFYSILFCLLIIKLPFFAIDNVSRRILVSLFLLKILSGVALAVVYTYYYKDRITSDVFRYYDDGKVIYSAIHHNPLDYFRMLTGFGGNSEHLSVYYSKMNFWFKEFNYDLYNDNRTIIRFNAFVSLFSFGSFHVHTVFMAFLSFIGLTAIFRTFYQFCVEKKWLIILAVFLAPSVLFWTSGVLKEGLVMFGIGLLVYSSYNLIYKKFKWTCLLFLLIGLLVLQITKFYVLIAAVPGIACFLILRLTGLKYHLAKVLLLHVVLLFIALNIHYISKYNFLEIMSKKQHDFVAMIKENGDVGSAIELAELKPSFGSLMKNAPQAFINSFFRPFIFEAKTAMMKFSALENLIIIVCFILAFFLYRRNKWPSLPLLYFSLSFVTVLFILTGLTTPVLGALVRYRVPAVPFLLLIAVMMINMDKLRKYYFKMTGRKEKISSV